MIKALRWAAAGLLGLLGGLLGLVGLVLCVTVILAPLGIPILALSRRLIRSAGDVVIPREVRHPIQAVTEAGSGAVDDLGRKGRKRRKRLQRSVRKATKRSKRLL